MLYCYKVPIASLSVIQNKNRHRMEGQSGSRADYQFSRRADPYSRLRIPKYQKLFEAIFFVMFLALYYAVLVERNPQKITLVEVFLYIWIAAFAYNEFGEFQDAGTLFYALDFWSLWDVGIVGIGAAYLVASMCLRPSQTWTFLVAFGPADSHL